MRSEGPYHSPGRGAVIQLRSHYKRCNAYDTTKMQNWLQLVRHKRALNSILVSISNTWNHRTLSDSF